MSAETTSRKALPRAVWALGFTSLFMDVSSELIHGLLPLFLVVNLGASAAVLGLVEGVAEAAAQIVKVFSGWLSDTLQRRKALAVAGYGLAALTKPLFPLAGTVSLVAAARVLDRLGKGIRGAPRDALVADVTPPEQRGAAFGLRQSLDTIGATIGPLAAIGLMALFDDDVRAVLWFAVVPALISVAILIVFVRDPGRPAAAGCKRPIAGCRVNDASGVDGRCSPSRATSRVIICRRQTTQELSMAASSLLALIDDIATVLDDISLMTKVAAKKTAGVLGDDLALNAQQVAGVRADRELPVVWAVAAGSLRNKAILVPAALAISAVIPWAITPLLMLGGAFLCFEGFEKLAHRLLHSRAEDAQTESQLTEALGDPRVDMRDIERDKIRGAIRTDFILSAEIIVITLGTVADAGFATQVAVLIGIALLMTAGVYGLVAGIVKLDDAGLWLSRFAGEGGGARLARWSGRRILAAAPRLMKLLSVAGTAAMFLVGGGILVHGLPWLHELIHGATDGVQAIPALGAVLAGVTPMLLNAVIGIVAGGLVLATVSAGRWVWRSFGAG